MLRQQVQHLLGKDCYPIEQLSSLKALHQLFIQLGAMDPFEHHEEVMNHLQLPSGRAIAPVQAGMCLFEIRRTRVFAQGLIDAITELNRQFPGRAVRVFDAGCGPFALLSLLAAACFTPEQVQFDVLDIHPASLDSARTLVNNLGLQAYFNAFICEDATQYRFDPNTIPDILITETMNRGLQKEPQVAITLHLAPQLPPHGILIPERVDVSLRMIRMRERNQHRFSAEPVMQLNPLFEEELVQVLCLSRQSTMDACSRHPLATAVIPGAYDSGTCELALLTNIRVFRENRLLPYECSLTMPLLLEPLVQRTVQAGDRLAFSYSFHPVPGLEFVKLNDPNG